jgi:hypothetical protein
MSRFRTLAGTYTFGAGLAHDFTDNAIIPADHHGTIHHTNVVRILERRDINGEMLHTMHNYETHVGST